jgi:hypothetical protein
MNCVFIDSAMERDILSIEQIYCQNMHQSWCVSLYSPSGGVSLQSLQPMTSPLSRHFQQKEQQFGGEKRGNHDQQEHNDAGMTGRKHTLPLPDISDG